MTALERIPIVATLRDYRRDWLRPDLVAGVVLATMLVPQGMAYADLTGLPAITGVYTTIAALVAYGVFGPNRRLVLGPDSSLAPVIAAVILPLSAVAGDLVALASAMSILAGLLCVLAGVLRLGVVTELLSKPIRIGYLNGIAILIFLSQLPNVFGVDIPGGSPAKVLVGTFDAIRAGQVVPAAVILAVAGVVLTLVLNRVSRLRPGVIVTAVGSIVAVSISGLEVAVVGEFPRGLPPFTIPTFDLDYLPALLGGALAVTLVSFADTGALSTATALKDGEKVDPNSEIKAMGASNLLSGLFQGFATSASSSRTAVALSVGSKTQVAGLVAAVGVVLIVLVFPGIVSAMPEPTLAAIVITASFALFDWNGWKGLLRARHSEFTLSAAATLGVLAVGVLQGLGIAIVLSLANFIRKAWRPHSTELGKVDGVPGYHDRERHPQAEIYEGLLIVRYDAPLFFANAPDFGRTLQGMIREANRPIGRVIVVGHAITDIDSTGAEILEGVLDDLDRRSIDLAFAGLKGPVKDRLKAYGLYDRIGDGSFFPTTTSAVEWHLSHRSE